MVASKRQFESFAIGCKIRVRQGFQERSRETRGYQKVSEVFEGVSDSSMRFQRRSKKFKKVSWMSQGVSGRFSEFQRRSRRFQGYSGIIRIILGVSRKFYGRSPSLQWTWQEFSGTFQRSLGSPMDVPRVFQVVLCVSGDFMDIPERFRRLQKA